MQQASGTKALVLSAWSIFKRAGETGFIWR